MIIVYATYAPAPIFGPVIIVPEHVSCLNLRSPFSVFVPELKVCGDVMLQVGVGGVVVKRIARRFTKEVLIGGTFGISHSVFHGDTAAPSPIVIGTESGVQPERRGCCLRRGGYGSLFVLSRPHDGGFGFQSFMTVLPVCPDARVKPQLIFHESPEQIHVQVLSFGVTIRCAVPFERAWGGTIGTV